MAEQFRTAHSYPMLRVQHDRVLGQRAHDALGGRLRQKRHAQPAFQDPHAVHRHFPRQARRARGHAGTAVASFVVVFHEVGDGATTTTTTTTAAAAAWRVLLLVVLVHRSALGHHVRQGVLQQRAPDAALQRQWPVQEHDSGDLCGRRRHFGGTGAQRVPRGQPLRQRLEYFVLGLYVEYQ